MSPKQWLALLCFFVSYLFFGASVFLHIEQDLEFERRAINKQQRVELFDLITTNGRNDSAMVDKIYDKLGELCSDDLHQDAPKKPFQWTFYHAFFFSFIVCSTIGYGNISPHSMSGQMFLIVYALIGIPVNGFLFAGLGNYFAQTFIGIYNRYKIYKMATTKNYMPMRFTLVGRILLYLMPGLVFFIFLPSCLFTYFEGWPYSTSIYYSFVTLTTIGFGDYVATFNASPENIDIWFYFYEAFVILWFIFGLGYLVMILSFIAKAMSSKRVTRLERQVAENLKATQQRIWNGVTKDVGHLGRILNELYNLRFKPQYEDDEDDDYANHLYRSASCPDDLMSYRDWSEFATPPMRRRRTASVPHGDPDSVSPMSNEPLVRIQSEPELPTSRRRSGIFTSQRITREQQILAEVVSALSDISAAAYNANMDTFIDDDDNGVGGVHGFSDADILASERNASNWTLNQQLQAARALTPRHRRSRAASVFSVPTVSQMNDAHRKDSSASAAPLGMAATGSHEWTWNGNNAAQMQEFLRSNTKPRRQSLFRSMFVNDNGRSGSVSSSGTAGGIAIGVEGGESTSITINQPLTDDDAVTQPSMFTKINSFRRRIFGAPEPPASTQQQQQQEPPPQHLTPQQYLQSRGRESRVSQSTLTPQMYLQATARGRKSTYSMSDTSTAVGGDLSKSSMPSSSSIHDPTSMYKKVPPLQKRIRSVAASGHRHSLSGTEMSFNPQSLQNLQNLHNLQALAGSVGDAANNLSSAGPKQYLQATKRGRKSLFSSLTGIAADGHADNPPTSASMEVANLSMLDIINPFRRRRYLSEAATDEQLTPQQYLEQTARGRASHAPFGSQKMSELHHDRDRRPSQAVFGPQHYLQATQRGRRSAYSMVAPAEAAVGGEASVLETTTIADLIRALEMAHSQAQQSPLLASERRASKATAHASASAGGSSSPRRKFGVSGMATLSPGLSPRPARRGSLRPIPAYTTVFNSQLPKPTATEAGTRRRRSQHFTSAGAFGSHESQASHSHMQSLQLPPPSYEASAQSMQLPNVPNRRFSVRPTNLSMAPGQVFSKPSVQAQSAVQRRLSLKPSPLARGATTATSGRFVRSVGMGGASTASGSSSAVGGGASAGAAVSVSITASDSTPPPQQQQQNLRPTIPTLTIDGISDERNDNKRSDSK